MEYSTVVGTEVGTVAESGRFFEKSFTLKQALAWCGVLLAILVLGAHCYRAGNVPGLAGIVGALGFHCSRANWKKYVVGLFLAWGVVEWGATVHSLVMVRQAMGMPWLRGGLILSAVAALTGLAALYTFSVARRNSEAQSAQQPVFAQVAAFALVFALLYGLRMYKPNILLLEHFFPLWGSVQIFLLAWYAALLVEKLSDRTVSRKTRRIAWFLFTVVYFGQIALGMAGLIPVAQSGNTHIPVPGFILYSPIFRGTFSMMPLLVLAATLLAGSAWCSMLCYFGSMEGIASYGKRVKKAPESFAFAMRYGRWIVLVAGAALALVLRFLQAPTGLTVALVAGFVLVSLVLMLVLSRRYTGMVHCTTFCPMGLVVNLLSKLSPWRVTIDANKCSGCGACEAVCGYRAINAQHRLGGKPGLSCSMCRDCVGVCPHKAIQMKLPFVNAARSGQVFTVVVVALHVLFIAAARPM